MVDMPLNQAKPNPLYLIYMYQEDLALNNPQWLICHKIKPNETNHSQFSLKISFLIFSSFFLFFIIGYYSLYKCADGVRPPKRGLLNMTLN